MYNSCLRLSRFWILSGAGPKPHQMSARVFGTIHVPIQQWANVSVIEQIIRGKPTSYGESQREMNINSIISTNEVS